MLKVAQLGRSRAERHTGAPPCHTHCLFAGHLSWGGEALAHLGLGGAHPAPPEREATPGQSSTPGHKWDWMDLGQVGWGSPSGERLSQFLGRCSRWQVLGKLGRPRRPRGWEGVEWWPQRYVHIPSPRSCKCDLIWNSHFCGCYKVKDLEVRPLWMGLKSRDTFLIRNERRQRQSLEGCSWKRQEGASCGAARGSTLRLMP